MEDGNCDFIALGRESTDDCNLPDKIKAGIIDEISLCVKNIMLQ